jgi:DnaJ-class molecular chaperone
VQDSEIPDHYATLGLDRRCTTAQVRAAYRLLAKRHHPDLHADSPEAATRTRELNAAHEVLSDPARRRAYDLELADREGASVPSKPEGKVERNITHDAYLRVEDFIRGVTLEVRVNDPANPGGPEVYSLTVPPETAPGARLRVPRSAPFEGGVVRVRLRVMPGGRWKARGADLRGELRISARRAAQGGTEMTFGPLGSPIVVPIPAGIGRGEIVRVRGEGLPKPRGGRGDLLVRISYRPEVRVSRARAW